MQVGIGEKLQSTVDCYTGHRVGTQTQPVHSIRCTARAEKLYNPAFPHALKAVSISCSFSITQAEQELLSLKLVQCSKNIESLATCGRVNYIDLFHRICILPGSGVLIP